MTIQSNLEKDFEINAAREFELHLLRYQELKRIEYRAGEDAASHQGILRNLAKLFPQLRDQFNAEVIRFRPGAPSESRTSGSPIVETKSETSSHVDEAAPRGVEAIRQVLSTHDGEWFSVAEIHEMLVQARLLETTKNSHRVLRNTLNRAINSGLVAPRKTDGSVFYNWKTNPGAEPNGSRKQ